ncbi:putative PKS-like protein biosynthetic cluster [Metarhizium rileyi]|uniref:Putative PKS-like protein biosynthetic cluster n=1 Tax=Metarhizium rileyi (strain RCEF 4871) TaxID=1649241 RepID=A0A5C6GKT8_METRR|nr:putative PKS-like protein biosynthetic cluster [Metarhizium rileyi]
MAPFIDDSPDAHKGFGEQEFSRLSSDIAIIGVSGRFPGDATSPRNLWDMVMEGRNAKEPIPNSRFSPNGFWHKDQSRAGTFGGTKNGYFVNQDIRQFDAGFFSITPEEAKAIDPVQRLLLETAYESLENAGLTIDQLADEPMGCFIGGGLHDYWDIQALDLDSLPKYSATGLGGCILANRISWFFNLRGPSMTIDTACSSSMTAMHLACQSIRSGESSSCLVGGFNLQLLPNFAIFATPMSFLSADDKCHSFDASANGYCRGEGGGFLVLKRMDLALRDGDTIRAVVRASGANQDGRTPGITQPSAIRQADLIRQTYQSAGLPLHETNYFEAHGTGTPTGDPIECSAIGAVFSPSRQRPLFVGSVKSNVGHLENVSGIVGMVKTVSSLESGWIAPTHGLTNINPRIKTKLAEWKVEIPTRAVRWPAGLRRASINNFGFGGSNAHVVIDDAYHYLKSHNLKAKHNTTVEALCTNGTHGANGASSINGSNGVNGHSHNSLTTITEEPTSRLFLLSSHEEMGIPRLSETLQKYLDEMGSKDWSGEQNRFLHRLAYTLSEKRSSLPWKTYAAASTIEELRQALDSARTRAIRTPAKARTLTFIFTGQGAQWYAMGRSLQKYAVFQQSLQESSAHLQSFGCTWDLIEELNRSAEESQIDLPSISQAACTALQLGVVDLLASWGIRPQAVIGHSSGEIAAGYAKGAFDKAAGMRIAYYRGLLTSQITKKGAMAAVGLGPEAARDYVDRVTAGKVVIACINSPESTTLSGDVEGIDEVMQLLQADDVFARKLRVLTAYHSHHMQLIAEEYVAGMEQGIWKPKTGRKDVTMFSSVKGKAIDGTELVPSYFVANLVSPVNFSGAVTAAAHAGLLGGKTRNMAGLKKGSPDVMVEIGPHAALQGPLKQIMASVSDKLPSPPRYLSVIKRKEDAIQTSLEMAGELFVLGHPVDIRLANAYDGYQGVQRGDTTDNGKISMLVELPPYAWNTSRKYWHESAAVAAYRNRSHARTELLGTRDEKSTDLEPCWRNLLRTSEQPWIEHHQFQSTNIYPMAGMIVMAIEGMREMQTRTDIEGFLVRDINIRKALVVPINETIETRLQLAPWRSSPIANDDSYWTEFKVSSRTESGMWTANSTGLIKAIYTPKRDSAVTDGVFVDEEAAANAQLQTDYKEIQEGGFPSLEPSVFYDKLDSAGFHLGPAFQGVKKLNLLGNKSHYTMEVEDTKQYYPAKWESPHLIHPSVLDVFVHLLTSSAEYSEGLTARMPLSTESLYISAKFDSTPGTTYRGFSRSRKLGGGGDKMASDVFAFSEDGGDKPVIALRGCQHAPLHGSASQSDDSSVGSAPVSLGGHVPIVPRLAPDVTMVDACQIQHIMQDAPDLATSLGKYVSLLAHKYPALDILECNPSGNSLLTRALLGAGGEIHKRVKSVVLSGAVVPEEQTGPWKQVIHHQQLVLSEDPVEQNFEEASRDLVVLDTAQKYAGSNAVVLANIKKLLKPSGVLVVANGFGNTSVIPDNVLASAGFAAPTTVNVPDASRLTIAYVAGRGNPAVQNILIVMPQSPSSKVSRAVERMQRELQLSYSYNIAKLPFDAAIPEQLSSYLALFALDLHAPFLEDLDENSFAKLRSLILGTQGSLWLTSDIESSGLVRGLGRTIRAEHPEIPFATLSLDSAVPYDAEVNVKTVARLIGSSSTLDQPTDSEYVIRKGQVLVERLEPDTGLKTLLDATQSGQSLPTVKMPLRDRGSKTLRLSFREPGSLESFAYHSVPGLTAEDPIAEGQMEIEVRSVSLNSRDIMMATGQTEDTNIGMECAGIVSRLGPGISKFRLGDRVFGLHPGCFQTRVRVDPRTFTRTPDYISDDVAGSLMVQYQTAVHSLINVGRLQRDESVLVHSAAGGVGQAAIIVAQYLGAKDIFCTVSSDRKKKFLMAEYGIPEGHIFNSRDLSFADGIMRVTSGRGVDVVLNSLTNEALRRTWKCVAPFGRFIELGKHDIYDNTGLEMRPFLNNITFAGVDIAALVTEYPDKCEELGLQVLELLEQGVIRPLKNITRYGFGQVEEAFRLMQSGNSIGKVVMMPRLDDLVPVVPEGLGAFRLPPNSTYVLVGGLGGIGRSIAKMLAEQGARHLVFLSRSGNTRPESQALLEELQGRGVSSTVTAVDVADKAQLEAALNNVKQSCPPIKGMIHCAMDLKDGIYSNMTAKDWNLSLRPKLKATRNLHELLPADLDFFVCLSSIAGIVGSRGQANYNAGNNYQDALMHQRVASGLAASSLNLSLVVGIGVSTENDGVFQLLKNGALLPMNERDVLNLVAAAVSGRSPTQVALGAATGGQLDKSSSNDPYWFDDSRFAVLSKLNRHSGGNSSRQAVKEDWKKLVAAATSKDHVQELVLGELVAGLSDILKMEQDDVDNRKSLPALGIDSLVAIEIRNWLRKEFQADLSVFDIVSNDPLSTFAQKVTAKSALIPTSLA